MTANHSDKRPQTDAELDAKLESRAAEVNGCLEEFAAETARRAEATVLDGLLPRLDATGTQIAERICEDLRAQLKMVRAELEGQIGITVGGLQQKLDQVKQTADRLGKATEDLAKAEMDRQALLVSASCAIVRALNTAKW